MRQAYRLIHRYHRTIRHDAATGRRDRVRLFDAYRDTAMGVLSICGRATLRRIVLAARGEGERHP